MNRRSFISKLIAAPVIVSTIKSLVIIDAPVYVAHLAPIRYSYPDGLPFTIRFSEAWMNSLFINADGTINNDVSLETPHGKVEELTPIYDERGTITEIQGTVFSKGRV